MSSSINFAKEIEINESITKDIIVEQFIKGMKKHFFLVKKVVAEDKSIGMNCSFLPIITILTMKGSLFILIEKNTAKIVYRAQTKKNIWFWFDLLFGLVTFMTGGIVIWFIIFLMSGIQKKSLTKYSERGFNNFCTNLKKMVNNGPEIK